MAQARTRFLTPNDQAQSIQQLMAAGWNEHYAKEGARMVCCGLKGDDNLIIAADAERILMPDITLLTSPIN
jgi:hypothetical protein